MIKSVTKGKIAVEKPVTIKVVVGDLSRIGASKFKKVEFVKTLTGKLATAKSIMYVI